MEASAVIPVVDSLLGMTKPTRVLFVGAFPPPGNAVYGGMVTSCRILMASSFPSRVSLDLLDSTQISNPPPRFAIRLLRAVGKLMRFVSRFEYRRPDVVVLFMAVGASIAEKGCMGWYARLRGVPVIMFPRGWSVVDDCRRSALTRAWVSRSFGAARTIVCQSEAWKRFAVDVLGFAPSNVAVMRNWTATRELIEVGNRRVSRRDGAPRLLFVGWLERDKGIFDLLEACRRLAGGRHFTLDIAGEGSASEEARAMANSYGLGGTVKFRGWLRGGELLEALAYGDILVLPSWAEGLPNVMVEAMAARLAVVITAVGAIPELIENRQGGMLVEPKDTDALVGALSELMDDAALREKIADQGHKIAVREFDVELAVVRLVDLITVTVTAGRAERLSGRLA
jgi:glycosyltransferase involved in cell wall biosynthesis